MDSLQIEFGFGWVKAYIRRHAPGLGGTNVAVKTALLDGLNAVGAKQMRGYFRKAGYDVTASAEVENVTVLAAALGSSIVVLDS